MIRHSKKEMITNQSGVYGGGFFFITPAVEQGLDFILKHLNSNTLSGLELYQRRPLRDAKYLSIIK